MIRRSIRRLGLFMRFQVGNGTRTRHCPFLSLQRELSLVPVFSSGQTHVAQCVSFGKE